ncbi:amidase signature enzyme [Sarocladium strictum]
MAAINLVEASIADLQHALNTGSITSVDLVARYLRRISTYDCRNTALNAIPVLNNNLFDEAAASDDRRVAGGSARLLEGIPFSIKDSYKVKGMATPAASPAFQNLIANEDAFLVQQVRDAGAVLLGRTNMPAVACGGMQRGIWGRAENPYNPEYLAAAFASGSTNGGAVSVSASLAAFSIGGETVSSGRSPASNNALIAYTPSRAWISIRGNWPLYPTCDTPVPLTKTMQDMFHLLDVITAEDTAGVGEFWMEQKYVDLVKPFPNKPKSFAQLASSKSLQGLRIAVPEIFLGSPTPAGCREIHTSPEVIALWEQARKDLEALGAEIVFVPDFPAMTAYENDDLLPEGCPRRPDNWNATERSSLIAHAWNDFLKTFNDSKLKDLHDVDPYTIYPDSLRTEPEMKFFEKPNRILYEKLSDRVREHATLWDIPGLEDAVKGLEGMRKVLLEDWLTSLGCDCVAFPAAGDVGPANADSDFEGARLAWQNGVMYSNGNRAMRHLGIPSVSVPMGIMETKKVPMNITFSGRAYDDLRLLQWANAFEARTKHRQAPKMTPALSTDSISLSTITTNGGANPQIEVTVDAAEVSAENIVIKALSAGSFHFTVKATGQKPVERHGLDKTLGPVARDQNMVVVLAREGSGGRPSGWLGLV